MMAALKQQVIDLIKMYLPDVHLLYLFGSRASNQEHEHSDLDLAILPAAKLLPVDRWQLQQKIAEQLNIDVDLVDLLFASTVMQKEVINTGVCLYDANHYAAPFEIQVMSMYQHLNEERAELLVAFKGE